MPFFELSQPRDMLDKTRREYQRLSSQFDIDNLFNYFVTAYHIQDYIRATKAVSQEALDTLLQDPNIKDCQSACNLGKHLKLTRVIEPTTRVLSGSLNGAPIGGLAINDGERWVLSFDSREVDVALLAKNVLQKWEEFFTVNGL